MSIRPKIRDSLQHIALCALTLAAIGCETARPAQLEASTPALKETTSGKPISAPEAPPSPGPDEARALEEAARKCGAHVTGESNFSSVPQACSQLGAMPEATAYLESACDSEDGGACLALAILTGEYTSTALLVGLVVPQKRRNSSSLLAIMTMRFISRAPWMKGDQLAAMDLLARACTYGVRDACLMLAFDGRGTGDLELRRDMGQLCERGSLSACSRWVYEAMGSVMKVNDDHLYGTAMKVFESACGAGSALACNSLAVLHHLGLGTARDDKKATEVFSRACALPSNDILGTGHWVGCGNLTIHALNTKTRKLKTPELRRAVEVLREGCKVHEHGKSCHYLGLATSRGLGGIKSNKREAKRLLRAACAQGVEEACR